MIEISDTFNTKWFIYKLTFGDLNDQPIPYNYYNLLNDDYDDGNNIPVTPVDALPDKKWVEYLVVPNDEDINDERIIMDYDDSLDSEI